MMTEVIRVNGKIGLCTSKFETTQIIDDMSKKGYSFVGYIPAEIYSYGRFTKLDLVFEKKD